MIKPIIIELTRELLERYLRATHDPALRDLTEMMDDGCSVRDILDSHIHSDCAEFRLGLCAAAESRTAELQRFREYEKARPTLCFGDNRGYWAGRGDEIERMRKLLLRAAGIEPDAWEDAKGFV